MIISQRALASLVLIIRQAGAADDITETTESSINDENPAGDGSRIVNGSVTHHGEFPFLVALADIPSIWTPWYAVREGQKVAETPYCTGSLVSVSHVLTACHCVLDLNFQGGRGMAQPRRPGSVTVMAGRNNINPKLSKEEIARQGELHWRFAKSFINHPKCLITFTRTIWDLGIIEVDKVYEIIPNRIETVDLLTYHLDRFNLMKQMAENTSLEAQCTAVGFGYNWEDIDMFIARKAAVVVRSFKTCFEQLHKATEHLIDGIVDFDNASQICTISAETPCNVDSGGPLICRNHGKTDYGKDQNLYGTVSFSRDCGNKSVPIIYSRIDVGLQWIWDRIRPPRSQRPFNDAMKFRPSLGIVEVHLSHYVFAWILSS